MIFVRGSRRDKRSKSDRCHGDNNFGGIGPEVLAMWCKNCNHHLEKFLWEIMAKKTDISAS